MGCAVRTPDAWAAHPQGLAVAARPLVGTAAGERAAGGTRRSGLARVLDLTRVIAGPVATRTLAAWGCEVLRLDSPHLPEIPEQAVDGLVGGRSALLGRIRPGRPGPARAAAAGR